MDISLFRGGAAFGEAGVFCASDVIPWFSDTSTWSLWALRSFLKVARIAAWLGFQKSHWASAERTSNGLFSFSRRRRVRPGWRLLWPPSAHAAATESWRAAAESASQFLRFSKSSHLCALLAFCSSSMGSRSCRRRQPGQTRRRLEKLKCPLDVR